MVSTLVDSWLPPPDPEEEAKEEKEEFLRQKELTKSIQERHIARIGKNGIKNKAVSEMILKRKLIRKNNQTDDEDNVSSDPMRHTNKNEDLEDSKISIKKSKVNSMDNDNISKKQFGGDFLSIYLAERDKKKKRKKKKNSKNKIS